MKNFTELLRIKLIATTLTFVCLVTSLSGCQEDEKYVISCTDGQVAFQLLNDDLNPGARLKEFDREDTITVRVIQSADELFDKLQIPFLKSKIDFKRETLLVGVVRTHSLAQVVDQQVESRCTSDEIILRATVGIGGIPATGFVHVFAIVPKISSGTKVRLIPVRIRK